MRFVLISLFVLVANPVGAASRLAEPRLPASAYSYDFITELPGTVLDANAAATLGRVLFYDRQLSKNGLVSCASCHSQPLAFDDPNRFSIGFQGKITRRSAMSLFNAALNPFGRFFRDGRAESLADQVLQPFSDPIEMGLAPGELEMRVAGRGWYAPLFVDAFGNGVVTQERIASALSAFVSAMHGKASRFESELAKAGQPLVPFAGFSDTENRGKHLFFAGRDAGGAECVQCHDGPGLTMTRPRDNGLPALPDRPDEGYGEVTALKVDSGLFRAASLMNIAVSPPYMRDGRFKTLEEVIAHYSSGISSTANLDPALRAEGGWPTRFDFSPQDVQALIAFLGTLTNESFLTDPRFADPFLAD